MSLNQNRKYDASYKSEIVIGVELSKESLVLVKQIIVLCESNNKKVDFSIPVKIDIKTQNEVFSVLHNLESKNKFFQLLNEENEYLADLDSNFVLDNSDKLFCEHQEEFADSEDEFLNIHDKK